MSKNIMNFLYLYMNLGIYMNMILKLIFYSFKIDNFFHELPLIDLEKSLTKIRDCIEKSDVFFHLK